MKKPVFWKASLEPKDKEGPTPSSALPDWLKVIGCVAFLIFSIYFWYLMNGSLFYYILFSLPTFICGEYLGELIFTDHSGLSNSESGFSILRIVAGVVFVLVLFGVIYGIVFILRWAI